MKQYVVAEKLRKIARLLELLGENSYKAKAYHKAARQLEILSEDVEKIWERGELNHISGVGSSISKHIEEILQTGESHYLQELKKRVSLGFLGIPGMNMEIARKLHEQLGVRTLMELRAALEGDKITKLPGVRPQRVQKLLQAIDTITTADKQILLSTALSLARELLARLQRVPGVQEISLVGGLRRLVNRVSQVELLAASDEPHSLLETFGSLPMVKEMLEIGPKIRKILTRSNIPVKLTVVEPGDYGRQLFLKTGSHEHIKGIVELTKHRGWQLEDERWLDSCGATLQIKSESDIYYQLGLAYIPPELREGRDEIQVAFADSLPTLLEQRDIQGDLHLHTRWSTGVHSLEEMAEHAQFLGYNYVAICDHFQSSMVKGMSLDILQEQIKAIDHINQCLPDFHLFKGVEVDILADGGLKIPESVWRDLDLVIAGVYIQSSSSETELTNQILNAVENPKIKIIGHPTIKLGLRESGQFIDMKRIIRAAATHNTFLEITGSPDTMEFSIELLKMCKSLGVKIVLNSNAHSQHQLAYMEFAVALARRGWLEKLDVINTYPTEQLF